MRKAIIVKECIYCCKRRFSYTRSISKWTCVLYFDL